MEIKHLKQKGGGRITAIHSVEHSTFEGVAEWYYIGDTDWGDGRPSINKPIMPWAVYFDHDLPEANTEYDKVSNALDAHLKQHGRWHDTKWVKEMAVRWTPKKPKLATVLA